MATKLALKQASAAPTVDATLENDAKRLFALHSPLIRRCIDRFAGHAREDGNGRLALGFLPLAPEKYARAAQLYQCVHGLMVCLYHLHRGQAEETTLEDWINLLQFDPVILRCNQGWAPGARLSEADDAMRLPFERMAADILAFRQRHLKDVLTFARGASEDAAAKGQTEARDLLQAVSDQFFLRQRRKEDAEAGGPVAKGDLNEQIKLPLSFFGGLLRGNV